MLQYAPIEVLNIHKHDCVERYDFFHLYIRLQILNVKLTNNKIIRSVLISRNVCLTRSHVTFSRRVLVYGKKINMCCSVNVVIRG